MADSYKNFDKEFYSAKMLTSIESKQILLPSATYEFEGEVKGGARLKILGLGDPTVTAYVDDTGLSAAEKVGDTSVFLDIDQFNSVHYYVTDIEQAQGSSKVLNTLNSKSEYKLSKARDTKIGVIGGTYGTPVTKTVAVTTAALAKAAVDAAFEELWGNDVTLEMPVEAFVTPWFYNLFKEYLISVSTDNPNMIKTGSVGYYNNALFRMTNSIYNDGTYDDLLIKTPGSIAFAGEITKLEAYRSHTYFADVVRGLDVFGVKMVRPNECISLQVKKA